MKNILTFALSSILALASAPALASGGQAKAPGASAQRGAQSSNVPNRARPGAARGGARGVAPLVHSSNGATAAHRQGPSTVRP
jgi:hypothetical protein